MNVEEETGPHCDGPYEVGLWARVRDWLVTWTAVFAPDEILRDGLTRRFALRCCSWLWPLEATVRRLIIAAALAFDPAKLGPVASRGRLRDAARPPSAPLTPASFRPTGFRIIAIRGAGSSKGEASTARVASAAPRHLPFPADDLLRLGATRQRQGQNLAPRAFNPLRRRGRIRPTDPDYTGQEADYANSSELLFGSSEARKPRPPRDPHAADRDLYCRIPAQPDESEWRRLEKEWERILPAPGIAARITALARVLEGPGQQIQRLARRLAAEADLAALLRGAPPPLLRKPKHDHLLPQVDEDLLPLAYAEMHPPDTS